MAVDVASLREALLVFVFAVLVESFFLHLAASFVLGGSRVGRAVLLAVVGSFVGAAIFLLLGGASILAFVIALVAWLIAASTIYRTGWIRALLIGVLAYVFFLGTMTIVEAVNKALAG